MGWLDCDDDYDDDDDEGDESCKPVITRGGGYKCFIERLSLT
jgi:hypothetical protein